MFSISISRNRLFVTKNDFFQFWCPACKRLSLSIMLCGVIWSPHQDLSIDTKFVKIGRTVQKLWQPEIFSFLASCLQSVAPLWNVSWCQSSPHQDLSNDTKFVEIGQRTQKLWPQTGCWSHTDTRTDRQTDRQTDRHTSRSHYVVLQRRKTYKCTNTTVWVLNKWHKKST